MKNCSAQFIVLGCDFVVLLFAQASLKTEREKKKEMYYPLRKYAIKA